MSSMVKRIARRGRARVARPRGFHRAGARTRKQTDTALLDWRAAWKDWVEAAVKEWSEAIAEGRPARAPGYRPVRRARL